MASTEEIIASPVFRAINAMIDEKALVIADTLRSMAAPRTTPFPPTLRVRTDLEGEAGAETTVELPSVRAGLDRMAACIAEVKAMERQVSDLQEFKMRLLGDPDLVRDDTPAKAVFDGAAPVGPRP
jgi:hypothetical protein